jgi:hypothetical protein
MAIIACPNCAKKISSRAAICSWCGFELGEVSEQDIEVYRARRLRERRYRLNMASYAIIAIFITAFGWYWWQSSGFLEPPTAGPLALMAVAAIAYIVVRALQLRNRYRLKALHRKQSVR